MSYENGPARPSSAGYPVPPEPEGLLDLAGRPGAPDVVCRPEEPGGGAGRVRSADEAAAFEEVLGRTNGVAQTPRPKGRVAKPDKRAVERLAGLSATIGGMVPFVGEYPRSLLRSRSPWATDVEVEMDPLKWGGGAAPRRRAEDEARRPGAPGCLVNPTSLTAKYERESLEGEEAGVLTHPFTEVDRADRRRYNRMVLASNELAQLWERRPDSSAFDVLKNLVLRTVISDREVGDRVLGEMEEYLACKARDLQPMTEMWHHEASLAQAEND